MYEGVIGNFTSYTPVLCSTQGQTTVELVATGSVFWLVVPSNGNAEGSYGRNNSGTERLPAVQACAPQTVGACP